MEMTQLKVNPLPKKTWHWLKMNDSDLEIELPDESPAVTLKGQTDGLKWRSGKISWRNMETGMGRDFASLLDNTQGFYLTIPDGHRAGGPAVIDVEAKEGGAAGQVLIHAGKDSEAEVVISVREMAGKDEAERKEDSEGNSPVVALQIKFYLTEGAKLKIYLAQTLNGEGVSCINIGGVCEESAGAELVDVSLGSSREYAGIAVKLEGDKSSFEADMGYRVRPSQRLDINYVARHEGKGSQSRMNAWGVLEDGSFKLFRGTIDFAEGCSGSVGKEKEDVLLLGEHQVNQTIPLILCHEEDVEGDHGATISRLDDQILFYLGSRGIDAKSAEDMISRAWLDALISRIPDGEVRDEAERRALS